MTLARTLLTVILAYGVALPGLADEHDLDPADESGDDEAAEVASEGEADGERNIGMDVLRAVLFYPAKGVQLVESGLGLVSTVPSTVTTAVLMPFCGMGYAAGGQGLIDGGLRVTSWNDPDSLCAPAWVGKEWSRLSMGLLWDSSDRVLSRSIDPRPTWPLPRDPPAVN